MNELNNKNIYPYWRVKVYPEPAESYTSQLNLLASDSI
jgi:hypothetical protein